MTPNVNVLQLYVFVTDGVTISWYIFPGKPFQASPMFASKTGCYTSGAHSGAP